MATRSVVINRDSEDSDIGAHCKYSEPFVEDGVVWIEIDVVKTDPTGAMVRWYGVDGGIIGEAGEGETIWIVEECLTSEHRIEIIKPIEE